MLNRVAAHVGGDFQGRPRSEAAIREAIGGAYESLGEFQPAEEHLRKAVALDTKLYGPNHRKTLRASNHLAAAVAGAGRHVEAERMLRQNLSTATRYLGGDDRDTLIAAEQLGALLQTVGRPSEAEPLLRETLNRRRRALPPDDPDTLRSVYQLCSLLVTRRQFDEAEELAAEYERGIRCSLDGPKHPDNVTALKNRGLIRRLQGKQAEAEPFYRRAFEEARRILGPEHPTTRSACIEYLRLFPGAELPQPADGTS
jgi:tetratricopeptide (TPR) repeat protein